MAHKRPREALDADSRFHTRFQYYGSETSANDRGARKAEVWDLDRNRDALDERGRKRFHGAFTGGFSAGYVNVERAMKDTAMR